MTSPNDDAPTTHAGQADPSAPGHGVQVMDPALWAGAPTTGRNGVAVAPRAVTKGAGYRSYEIHQRMRVRQSTEKLDPSSLVSDAFAHDPYPALETLREHYPCFRDWIGNSYWVSRYDDVTSVFVDEANFETRSRLWFYGAEGFGRNLGDELPVLVSRTTLTDRYAGAIAETLVEGFAPRGEVDLALEFAAPYPLKLLMKVLDLPDTDFDWLAERLWTAWRGHGWRPTLRRDGLAALRDLSAYFDPLVTARRRAPGEDMISAIAGLELDGPPASGADVATTLLEMDHETLHGALANLGFLLLTHPSELARVTAERRLVKFAYLETLRHSGPVIAAKRFARHEVERFGFLLPEGALVICAAAAGNRDPRLFDEPDRFIVERKDLCQREPRGQYRADGLPAGIAFGLGKPSRFPALPEDRPRSLYALTRDTAVAAVNVLLDRLPHPRLKPGATPELRALSVGEMHCCWSLPTVFGAR